MGTKIRAWLARQAYTAAFARGWLHVLPRRNIYRYARDCGYTIGNYCGSCTKCIDICPTRAIIAPYRLDARRCISYLTIEHKGNIPEALGPLIGNRVYGCDDCQLICPWNKFAVNTVEEDFAVRNGLDDISLVELFQWTKEEFDARFTGSPIRRIGYEQWLRDLAVGLGNAPTSPAVIEALRARRDDASSLVREHVGLCKITINALFSCHFIRMVAGQMGKLLAYMDYRPGGRSVLKSNSLTIPILL